MEGHDQELYDAVTRGKESVSRKLLSGISVPIVASSKLLKAPRTKILFRINESSPILPMEGTS